MNSIGDYNKIVSDHDLFNKVVYTPLSEALKILDERQKDPVLIAKIEKLLNGDIPEPLKNKDRYGIFGKQVATPNYDARWFIDLTRNNNLKTFFYEYHHDKFTSKNYFKYSLGQIHIHNKCNKKGENIEEKITIIDFNKSEGEKIKNIKTLWGESLVNFHKKIFEIYNYNINDFIFYDGSEWLERNGGSAINYYKKDLLLYVCHGILFENFLIEGEDGKFTREILLPSFDWAYQKTGYKPLIVPIPPMEDQTNNHWVSYGNEVKKLILKSFK